MFSPIKQEVQSVNSNFSDAGEVQEGTVYVTWGIRTSQIYFKTLIFIVFSYDFLLKGEEFREKGFLSF